MFNIASKTHIHTSIRISIQHGIYPTLIHSIKPYHTSSNIYPRAASTSKIIASTRHLIKHIQSFKPSIMVFINQGDQSSYSKMHVHIHMHDLPSLTLLHHNTSTPMHQCMFMWFIKVINPNYQFNNQNM